jgi:hypothetical protein
MPSPRIACAVVGECIARGMVDNKKEAERPDESAGGAVSCVVRPTKLITGCAIAGGTGEQCQMRKLIPEVIRFVLPGC